MPKIPVPARIAAVVVALACTGGLAFAAGSADAAAPKPAPTSAPPLPTKPFTRVVPLDGALKPVRLLGPASGTVALTHITVATFGTTPDALLVFRADVQKGGICPPSPASPAALSGLVDAVAVPAGSTVDQPFTTPIVLSPAAVGGKSTGYCLYATARKGDNLAVTVTGYTVSGSTVLPVDSRAVTPGARLLG
ncbi:MAG TPA: hypothetical protein VE781_01850 [Kineosporiaceae bacterium]|jgi:hypothetical protein|nr:hypothetical protein [Kineosporiaceae bacterium]